MTPVVCKFKVYQIREVEEGMNLVDALKRVNYTLHTLSRLSQIPQTILLCPTGSRKRHGKQWRVMAYELEVTEWREVLSRS